MNGEYKVSNQTRCLAVKVMPNRVEYLHLAFIINLNFLLPTRAGVCNIELEEEQTKLGQLDSERTKMSSGGAHVPSSLSKE